MDSKEILYIKDVEEDSCGTCDSGVLVPNNTGKIYFAKCLEEYFNFNLYEDGYGGGFTRNRKYFIKQAISLWGEKIS